MNKPAPLLIVALIALQCGSAAAAVSSVTHHFKREFTQRPIARQPFGGANWTGQGVTLVQGPCVVTVNAPQPRQPWYRKVNPAAK